jgi:putative transposase
MMPSNFPAWSAVYYFFKLWRDNGRWLEIHDSLAEKVRVASGKNSSPSVVIIDSQSVKTTQKGDQIGYDAGKKNQRS